LNRRRKRCPKCGQLGALPIAYGYPSPEQYEAVERGEVVLGGCCVWDGMPEWRCQGCDHEWGNLRVSDQPKRDRDYYLSLRNQYKPVTLKLIFVCESPPASGKYFYDKTGCIAEHLFRAMTRDILGYDARDKEDGLRAFQAAGYFLVDATYAQVDKGLTEAERDSIILRGYPQLEEDLLGLDPQRRAPLILVKKNVCEILGPRLATNGFRVLNEGQVVYYPSTGNQKKFRSQMSAIFLKGIESSQA